MYWYVCTRIGMYSWDRSFFSKYKNVCIGWYTHVFARIVLLVIGICLYWYVMCTYMLVSVCIDDIWHTLSSAVSLGCIYDETRSEPGSWLVVGMIPVFRDNVALRAGRPRQGPDGCSRRKIHLLHQCYAKLLEGCLLYTSPSPRDRQKSRMPSSA